jgi:radical SAM superfamily enzyme YgiQ (UPF0313 family)
MGMRWISQCSINLAKDPELLKLAADSGCVGMLIGLESLSEKTINSVGKKVNRVEEYAKAIKKIHDAGIGIIGCFVFGFDDEEANVFKKTAKFINKTNIEIPQVTVLTPFPGTVLRTKMEEEERILHNNWQYYDATSVVFQPKNMSPEELRKRYDKMASKIYSYPAMLRRVIKSFFMYRSFAKMFIFWQINVVYRRLWMVSVEKNSN